MKKTSVMGAIALSCLLAACSDKPVEQPEVEKLLETVFNKNIQCNAKNIDKKEIEVAKKMMNDMKSSMAPQLLKELTTKEVKASKVNQCIKAIESISCPEINKSNQLPKECDFLQK